MKGRVGGALEELVNQKSFRPLKSHAVKPRCLSLESQSNLTRPGLGESPQPASDRERPSLFTLNRLTRSLQTPEATYELVPCVEG